VLCYSLHVLHRSASHNYDNVFENPVHGVANGDGLCLQNKTSFWRKVVAVKKTVFFCVRLTNKVTKKLHSCRLISQNTQNEDS